jgi:hypothetical protein
MMVGGGGQVTPCAAATGEFDSAADEQALGKHLKYLRKFVAGVNLKNMSLNMTARAHNLKYRQF